LGVRFKSRFGIAIISMLAPSEWRFWFAIEGQCLTIGESSGNGESRVALSDSRISYIERRFPARYSVAPYTINFFLGYACHEFKKRFFLGLCLPIAIMCRGVCHTFF
jgi:hypothetical protein